MEGATPKAEKFEIQPIQIISYRFNVFALKGWFVALMCMPEPRQRRWGHFVSAAVAPVCVRLCSGRSSWLPGRSSKSSHHCHFRQEVTYGNIYRYRNSASVPKSYGKLADCNLRHTACFNGRRVTCSKRVGHPDISKNLWLLAH